MGAFCCCSCGDDFDDYSYPNNSIHRHCTCLRFFLHQLYSGDKMEPRFSPVRPDTLAKLANPLPGASENKTTVEPFEDANTAKEKVLIRFLKRKRLNLVEELKVKSDKEEKANSHTLTYTGTYDRVEGRSASASIQATSLVASGIGTSASETSSNDSHITVPRPIPFDVDQRYSRMQRDGLVSRRDKSLAHFQEDSQPLRRNISSSGIDLMGLGKKWDGVDLEDDHKPAYGLVHMRLSAEDEDVCPTCLEEYTSENPKITARCSHHFHLGCIYEWMERSANCPICGKEMEFSENS